MKNPLAALASILIFFALAATASAGTRMQLSDWQMDAVTAGSAVAIAALQVSAAGQSTAIQTSVGNIAEDGPYGSLAQSQTAVLATGAGNASLAIDVVNQSAANGYGRSLVASASTAGSAGGDTATVQSVGVTTALSASSPSGQSWIGITDALANIITYSVSGSSH